MKNLYVNVVFVIFIKNSVHYFLSLDLFLTMFLGEVRGFTTKLAALVTDSACLENLISFKLTLFLPTLLATILSLFVNLL